MAGWSSLPPEVMREAVQVAVKSNPESACEFATISRDWQDYVEEKTFASLKTRSTQIQQLRDIVTPLRQSYIRNMIFEVVLPEYDAKSLAWYKETLEEQKLNSRFFTDAILLFFDAVAGWNSPAAGKLEERRGISLRISASCPSDKVPDRYGVLRRRYKRWDRSVLEILQDYDRKIPLLPAISEFLCGDDFHSRKLSPRACCDIAAQMPNVHTLEWKFWFRYKLDLSLADPYFLAAAHAAQHMPRLKEFFLEWMATPLPCGLEYKISNDGGPRAMLTLWGSPPAEPSLELKEAWGKVTEILVGSPDMMEVELQDEGRVFEPM
ncbi:hypothetical protein SCAR479_05984 [Seiridium cardinale]|uniref:F-box domain-containing protein n=1 Tax=Seiridium cardinale TaxID=138064 RepID=A0ABR2XTW8_9PEZI